MEAELDATSPPTDPDSYDEGVTFEEVEKYSDWTAKTLPDNGARGKVRARLQRGLRQHARPAADNRRLSDYGYPGIHCLVGLSGHGFKLCPEFGRLMATLVVEGRFETTMSRSSDSEGSKKEDC